MTFLNRFFVFLLFLSIGFTAKAQENPDAKPWVFWYWMQASVSKVGITADLEAMKEAGIGGAYLMPIKGETNPPIFTPTAPQLSPQWWDLVTFAFAEAKRLHLKLGMHFSDGFALGGGPWITPELSMQKVVFSRMDVAGGKKLNLQLPIPNHLENYYKDIQIIAFPSLDGAKINTQNSKPIITSSTGEDVDFLIKPDGKKAFRSAIDAFVTYQFKEPFTCRTIRVESNGNNYEAQR